MKKKLACLMTILTVGAAGAAFAAPQTEFQNGEVQIDAGAFNAKASMSDHSDDTKWNFTGGVTYGVSDKVAVQYNYSDLQTKSSYGDGNATKGNQQEVNVLYSVRPNVAVYGGYNRIDNDFGGGFSKTNNIAQVGVIAKAPIAPKLDVYGKVAVGTEQTTIWEAGLGYNVTKDLDINAGYRYINTKAGTDGDGNDHNISYKGFVGGLSYRFGGL